jgi:tetratricopeptide (TPR) repeat protein
MAAAERERLEADALPPVRAVDHFLLGQERYKRDPLAGLRHFDDALHVRPDHFWAQCLASMCLLQPQVARPAEARARLTACLQREPEFGWLYMLRGVASTQYAGALLNQADRDPARSDGLREEAERQFDLAEDDYRRALELLGTSPNVELRYGLLVNRGLLRLLRGFLDQAAGDLRAAIGLDGAQSPAYAALARVLQKQGHPDEALHQLSLAIEREPGRAELYRARAEVDLYRPDATPEQRARALRDLERAIRLERPGDGRAVAQDHFERAWLLKLDHREAEALAACEAAIAARGDFAGAHQLRISLLSSVKDFDAVIRSCDDLINRGMTSAWAFKHRGVARSYSRDYAGAIEDYTRALDSSSGQPSDRAPVLAQRGWLYLQIGAPRLALPDFEAVIALRSGDADGYEGRGLARARLGQHRDAAADAKEALRLAPPGPHHLCRIAHIYMQAAVAAGAEVRKRGRDTVVLVDGYQERAVPLLLEALRCSTPDEAASVRHQLQTDPVLRRIQRRVLAALERAGPALFTVSSADPPMK